MGSSVQGEVLHSMNLNSRIPLGVWVRTSDRHNIRAAMRHPIFGVGFPHELKQKKGYPFVSIPDPRVFQMFMESWFAGL